MTLTLPFPPSVNRYWRHPSSGALAGRHLISAEGRGYRDAVAWICRKQCIQPLEGWLALEVQLTPPDRRRRDVDNCAKALLDALQHAGVMRDDHQVRRLVLEMGEPGEGAAIVRLEAWRAAA